MSMMQDVRFASRMLIKDPWFTLIAVVALGLGIGVNNTVFTFVNAVLLRGLPFEDSAEIVHVSGRNTETGNDGGISWPDYQDMRRRTATFASLGAFRGVTMNLSDSGQPPERVNGVLVSANAFEILRQPPLLGRGFTTADEARGAEPVALIGYSVWQSRYGGDPGVIGRAVKINEVPATIVGVMPQGMRFPANGDLWQPIVPDAAAERRTMRTLNIFGRLAPGASMRSGQTELSGIAAALAAEHPESNKNMGVEVMTFNDRFNGGPIRMIFLVLMGAVGFVLLIACANVANLLLARSARRSREIAVRVALGATRGRVVRQLLIESVMLAGIAGVAGLLLSLVGVRLFDMAVADVGKPYWIKFTMDVTVFTYLALICVATGVIFGLAPALQVSRTNLNEILKEGGRGNAGGVRARWLTSSMVVAEIALTLVLLVGAGLMARSFYKLYAMDLGFDGSRLTTMRLTLAERKYPTPEERRTFYDALLPRLRAIPGVEDAALTSHIPLGGSEVRNIEIQGRPIVDVERAPETSVVRIGPTHFDTMGVPLQAGRAFTDQDGMPGANSAIVNARFAAQHFPAGTPIGERIRIVAAGSEPGSWFTIVGVVPTIRQRDMQAPEPDPVVFLPHRATPPQSIALMARAAGDPAALTSAIRAAVQSVDPDQPVFNVQTMDQFLAQTRWPFRVFGSLFAIFALIALTLSAVGIYAVTSYSVTQRTPEIGVRMALGARPAQVSWLVLRQGVGQLAIGLLIGVPAAYGLSRLMQSILAQIQPTDPLTFVAIPLLLSAITLVACLVPAWRATRLDPLKALRVD